MSKIREIQRTANIAWSDAGQEHILLATCTNAQQIDHSFNTAAALEIWSVDLASPLLEMPCVATVNALSRVHKLLWTPATSAAPSGLLVGGMDGGHITIFNAGAMLGTARNSPIIVHQSDHHQGPVHALDVNPTQTNLLASGASEGEIFIWDLNNPTKHLTPGAKPYPAEDVTSVAWNRQVQHILASASASGRAIMWDLRANKHIITLHDAKMRCRSVCWHPDQATQLVLASEDDHQPIVQVWDLRNAQAPMKEMASHTRGILAADWCAKDANLLLTASKDNTILCWNPQSATPADSIVASFPPARNWVFDVRWCPRHPDLFATSSFDGSVSVYSLTGGNKSQANTPFGAPQSQTSMTQAPKWLKRPVGASFSFGGRLITYRQSKTVTLHHVNVEREVVAQARGLQAALTNGDLSSLAEYTQAQVAKQDNAAFIWRAILATLDTDPRPKFLSLFGYNFDDIDRELQAMQGQGALTQQMDQFGMQDPPRPLTAEMDALLCKAIRAGRFAAAAMLCVHAGRMADALVLAVAGGPDLLAQIQEEHFKRSQSHISHLIADVTSRRWSDMVDKTPLGQWQDVLAVLLTYGGMDEFSTLCETLGRRLQTDANPQLRAQAIVCFICAGNLDLFLDMWLALFPVNTPQSLHDLISAYLILRKSVELKVLVEPSARLLPFGRQYVTLLANEGFLDLALAFVDLLIPTALATPADSDLRQRLEHAARSELPPTVAGPIPDTPITRPPASPTAAPQAPAPGYHPGYPAQYQAPHPTATAAAPPAQPQFSAHASQAQYGQHPSQSAAPQQQSSYGAQPSYPAAPAAAPAPAQVNTYAPSPLSQPPRTGQQAPPSSAAPTPPTSHYPPASAAYPPANTAAPPPGPTQQYGGAQPGFPPPSTGSAAAPPTAATHARPGYPPMPGHNQPPPTAAPAHGLPPSAAATAYPGAAQPPSAAFPPPANTPAQGYPPQPTPAQGYPPQPTMAPPPSSHYPPGPGAPPPSGQYPPPASSPANPAYPPPPTANDYAPPAAAPPLSTGFPQYGSHTPAPAAQSYPSQAAAHAPPPTAAYPPPPTANTFAQPPHMRAYPPPANAAAPALVNSYGSAVAAAPTAAYPPQVSATAPPPLAPPPAAAAPSPYGSHTGGPASMPPTPTSATAIGAQPGYQQPPAGGAPPNRYTSTAPAPAMGGYGAPPAFVAAPRSAPKSEPDKRWNDPPPLTKKSTAAVAAPQAITNPLRPMAPAAHMAPPGVHQPGAQPAAAHAHDAQPQNFAQTAPAAAPAPQAAPIPEPYQYLVQSFDACVAACVANNNPAYRKKLEDVTRRLDTLKDKLRAGEVDNGMAQQLHTMAYYVQNRDFNSALQLHQQCVVNSNPDQTAIYLTGLKSLLTLAKSILG